MNRKHIYLIYPLLVLLSACIENDIPYPLREGNITAFEVEGMCDENGNEGVSVTINKQKREITLNVDDRVLLSDLRITRMQVTNDARISLTDSMLAHNYAKFPHQGFASLEDLYVSSDTRVNFTKPVTFRLSTYQQYDWQISVNQIVNRTITIDGQVGDAVIDPYNHNVVVYVSADRDLSRLHVTEFTLGGRHGSVLPDPVKSETFDFSGQTEFYVRHAYEEISTLWHVFVYHTNEQQADAKATVFPMSTRAVVSGSASSGVSLGIEYRKANEMSWTTLGSDEIIRLGSKFTANITHLVPGTSYALRCLTNGKAGDEVSFVTADAPQLTDGSFDNWHKEGKTWNPWAQGSTSFWDSGNKGATTVGESNTAPTTETCDGKGQAALLESKYIVVKFAAGNIFTGEYVQTDGTNGILDFGRSFTGFPSALRVNYKYKTSTINRSADADYEYLKGRPDSCQIYIALADCDQPIRIRTRPSTRKLLDPKGPEIIAYGQMTVGQDVESWTQQDIKLEYYPEAIGRTPKYIIVVASASKFGDFFTGGEGSKLWIDNFELIYE